MTIEEIIARRAHLRAARRRRRLIAASVGMVAVVIACILAVVISNGNSRGKPAMPLTAATSVSPAASNSASTPAVTQSVSASPEPTPTSVLPSTGATASGDVVSQPLIVHDYITFGAKRRAEMASYALKHYGLSSITLHPKLIVLHYTDSSTYAAAHATFESDTPNMGVLPGTVAHFVIDKDGTIYQQLPLNLMGRHAVGVNWCAIGIEMVQEQHGGDSSTVAQILDRPAQRNALVRLVRWLMYHYHIPAQNVIGHAMANDSHYFRDLVGWRNDHTDWALPQVLHLRALLKD